MSDQRLNYLPNRDKLLGEDSFYIGLDIIITDIQIKCLFDDQNDGIVEKSETECIVVGVGLYEYERDKVQVTKYQVIDKLVFG